MLELREILLVLLLALGGTSRAENEDMSDTSLSPSDGPAKRPSFAVQEQVHTVKKGETAVLPCTVLNLDKDSTTGWMKERNTMLFNDLYKMIEDDRMSVTEEEDNRGKYDLTIEAVVPFDSGTYECKIFTDGPEMTLRQTLVVQTPPYASITPDLETVTVKSGDLVILACYTGGNPPPNVTWTREDNMPVHKDQKMFVGSKLAYESAKAHHSGKYICTASNGVGENAVATINLEVKNGTENKTAPVILHKENVYVPVVLGSAVELTCEFEAEPVNDVYWSQNGFRIDTAESSHKYQEYRRKVDGFAHRHMTILTIKNAEHSDVGEILCRIVNDLSSDSHTLHLSERPGPTKFVLDTPKSDATSIYLVWFVQSPTVITGFELKYRKHNSHRWEHIHIPGKDVKYQPDLKYEKTYRLQNLEPETKYEINIRAQNAKGHGSWATKDVIVTTGVSDGTSENVKPTVEGKKSTSSCSRVSLNWVFLSLAILLYSSLMAL